MNKALHFFPTHAAQEDRMGPGVALILRDCGNFV
jgi:hypothetical protein